MAITGPGTSIGKEARRRPQTARDVLGHAMMGLISGAVLGYLLLPYFLPPQTARALAARAGVTLLPEHMFWLPAIAGAALGFVLGALWGVVRRPPPARDADYRQKAAALDKQFSAASDPALADKLHALFPKASLPEVRNVMRARPAGIEFTICDLHYEEMRGTDRHRRHVEIAHTVAYREPPGAGMPPFMLQPESLVLDMVWGTIGMKDIDFPAHPRFSKAYHLLGVQEDDVRRLFNPRVLDALARHPGLTIRSHGNGIALYRKEQLCASDALKRFSDVAAEIFRVLEDAARHSSMAADASPPPRANARAQAGKVPGLIGWLIRRERVMREDVEAFIRQAPPRRIPANLLAYVERQASKIFVAVGVVFTVAGITHLLVYASQAAFGAGFFDNNVIGGLLGLLATAIGAPIAFFSIRARHRIKRLLRRGLVGKGRIESVKSTGVRVNDMPQHSITVRYQAGGVEQLASCKDVGRGAERARSHAAAGTSAPILYDPDHPERILLLDALAS